ncbi:MAG: hypothetical protein GY832_25050 [Chloroflexi bacterium]|nr:hypothetical protein [Chloroflexota bacterium]
MAKQGWPEAIQKILDALDILAEYRNVNVDITGSEPDAKGWVTCRAFWQKDKNPSAGVNIGEHPTKGRYHEFSDKGRNLSFFDFMAMARPELGDRMEAVRYFAKQAGIKLPDAPKNDPNDQVAPQKWNDDLAKTYCDTHKKGITPESILMAGATMGGVPKGKANHKVFSFPVYGPHFLDADPVGQALLPRNGKTLPVFQGKDKPPIWKKSKTTFGSTAGWIGKWALQHIKEAEIVWKVEGVTDLLTLQSIIPKKLEKTHLVISNSGGAMETPRAEMIALFAGLAEAFVVGDLDKSGQTGVRRFGESIATVAKETRLVKLPGEITEKHGFDLRDWILAGGTYEELLKLARAGELIEAAKPTQNVTSHVTSHAASDATPAQQPTYTDEIVCGMIKLDVLGEWENGQIEVYSEFNRKNSRIRDINRVSYADLLQIAGKPARQNIHQGREEVPGMASLTGVREAVAYLAGGKRLHDRSMLGPGVWAGRKPNNDEDGSIVLTGSQEGAIYDGDTLELIKHPRIGGLLLHFAGGKPWYDFETLKRYLELAKDRTWASAVGKQGTDLFSQWRWKHKMAPSVITGAILATFVQVIWGWRPQMAIIGASKSGKSVLFATLKEIFGGLSSASSQSSAAGIRQDIGNSSRVILCDEFDSTKEKQKILDMLRASSRGDSSLRGTAHQASVEYRLQHIGWLAGINVLLERAPDRNRFIVQELLPARPGDEGNLVPPQAPELRDLGQKLLATAIHYGFGARKLALELRGKHHKAENGRKIDDRIVDSYACPSSILSALMHHDMNMANTVLAEIVKTTDGEEVGDGEENKDEIELLRSILNATTSTRKGARSVAQLIDDIQTGADDTGESEQCLARSGVKIDRFTDKEKPGREEADCLFLAPRVVADQLLKDTLWRDQGIKQVLLRVRTAIQSRRRVGGTTSKGVAIDFDYIHSQIMSDDEPTPQSTKEW